MNNLDLAPTLVMGARSGIGRLVLDDLLDRGMPVRASTRRPERGQVPDGVELVAADLTDRRSLEAAFTGVGQVFLFANHEGVGAVIGAAHSAGVERLVLLSSGAVIHPSSAGNRIAEEHREIEEALAAGGLTVTPIRPLVLATNALAWARAIRAGVPLALYQPDALTAPIHERDIAAVTVAALGGADGVSGMLTGSERLSQRAQVAAIAAAIGREIPVVELTRDDAMVHFLRFMPDWEAEAILGFLGDAAAENSIATDTVDVVLGRPALGFTRWAIDHADDYR